MAAHPCAAEPLNLCRGLLALLYPMITGRPASLWDYKHRHPVVLVSCIKSHFDLQQYFTSHYGEYHEAGAELVELISINPTNYAHHQLPFSVQFGYK